jgi:hypothetical protein
MRFNHIFNNIQFLKNYKILINIKFKSFIDGRFKFYSTKAQTKISVSNKIKKYKLIMGCSNNSKATDEVIDD